jgi:hypothetical protein
MSEPQTITCKAAVAWEANKPLEILDVEVAPPQVRHVPRPPPTSAASDAAPAASQPVYCARSAPRFTASCRITTTSGGGETNLLEAPFTCPPTIAAAQTPHPLLWPLRAGKI